MLLEQKKSCGVRSNCCRRRPQPKATPWSPAPKPCPDVTARLTWPDAPLTPHAHDHRRCALCRPGLRRIDGMRRSTQPSLFADNAIGNAGSFLGTVLRLLWRWQGTVQGDMDMAANMAVAGGSRLPYRTRPAPPPVPRSGEELTTPPV